MAEEQRSTALRPEESATIVQNFSADLDSMFGLSAGGGVPALEQTIQQKKQNVTSASEQLQELEAKLRDTEQRLARVSRQNSPSRQATAGVTGSHLEQQQQVTTGAGKSPLAQQPVFPDDRPPTAGRPQNVEEDADSLVARMPGALPETPRPQNGSSDYVMVDRGDGIGEPGTLDR